MMPLWIIFLLSMDRELENYLLAHISAEPSELHQLDRDAHVHLLNPRMSAGHWQGRLLTMLTRLCGARRVLELGTFAAYSALCLAEGVGEDGSVITIERDDEKEDFICQGLARSPYGNRVELLIGDAMELLATFKPQSLDLIYMDADKRQYPDYYTLCKPLLACGGLLIADNTLWGGHLLDPRYGHDARTLGIRRFNDMVVRDPDMEVIILPVRDGISLVWRRDSAAQLNDAPGC